MKKLIMIGQSGCGKTTLSQRMHAQEMEYKKTQAVDHFEMVIDTPGEYIENKFYYKALIVTSADADVIGLVQDCTVEESCFPPSFGGIFSKPIIGIVTKADLAESEAQIERASEFLRMAGAESIFITSSMDGKGIDEIKEYVKGTN